MQRRNPVDFEHIDTYMEAFYVAFLIFSGTYLFTFQSSVPWIASFVILTCAIILSILGLYQYHKYNKYTVKEDDPPKRRAETLIAGFAWVLWLAYGILFKDMDPFFPASIGYLQSGIAMLIVFLTYWNTSFVNNPVCTHFTFIAVLSLLLLPHNGAISHKMNTATLFTKISAFYVLFLSTEISQLYEESLLKKKERNKRYRGAWKYQIKLIRSVWVLLVSNYLVIASVFQFFKIVYNIRVSQNKLSERDAEPLREVRVIKSKAKPKRESATRKHTTTDKKLAPPPKKIKKPPKQKTKQLKEADDDKIQTLSPEDFAYLKDKI